MNATAYSRWLRSSFWLFVPLLGMNLALASSLPHPEFHSDAGSSGWILWPEGILRIAVFATPLFFPLRWKTRRERAGLALFALGSLLYVGSWMLMIYSPSARLEISRPFALLPYLTPLLFFWGVALLAGSRAYALLAFTFVIFHTAHGVQAFGLLEPHPTSPPLRSAEAIVVLGNRPPLDAQGELRAETERRLSRGLELHREGLAPLLVLSGGPYPGGGTEAVVMAEHAAARGARADAIRVEGRSADTAENARETVALLCRDRLPGCAPEVIVVSSDYHVDRAVELFRCAGAVAQPASVALERTSPERIIIDTRELLVRFSYLFYDPCERARPAR